MLKQHLELLQQFDQGHLGPCLGIVFFASINSLTQKSSQCSRELCAVIYPPGNVVPTLQRDVTIFPLKNQPSHREAGFSYTPNPLAMHFLMYPAVPGSQADCVKSVTEVPALSPLLPSLSMPIQLAFYNKSQSGVRRTKEVEGLA